MDSYTATQLGETIMRAIEASMRPFTVGVPVETLNRYRELMLSGEAVHDAAWQGLGIVVDVGVRISDGVATGNVAVQPIAR